MVEKDRIAAGQAIRSLFGRDVDPAFAENEIERDDAIRVVVASEFVAEALHAMVCLAKGGEE